MAALSVYGRFHELHELIDGHRLLERALVVDGQPTEAAAVVALGERMGRTSDFDELPGLMAKAIVDGMSLEGTLDALSLAVATYHQRSDYGNPLDVHMQNGLRVRRYLLKAPGLTLRTRLTALLSWAYGPEIRLTQGMMNPAGDASDVLLPPGEGSADAGSDGRDSEDRLLHALTRSIEERPPVGDIVYSGSGRGSMRADPGVREAMRLARGYLDSGFDSRRLVRRLTEIVCRDSFTEMHAFEHLDDSVREYEALGDHRGRGHLISAVKIAYCGYGIDQSLYRSVEQRLHHSA